MNSRGYYALGTDTPDVLVCSATLFCFTAIIAKASLLVPKSSFDTCSKTSYMDNPDCKLAAESSEINSMTEEDISYALQKMSIAEMVNEDVNNLDINLNTGGKDSRRKNSSDQSKFKDIRKWKTIDKEKVSIDPEESFKFKLLSFNILAQDLLEGHPYLYKDHNTRDLKWENRKPLLVQEILESKAHVICLQEMQENHLKEFLITFQHHGFSYLYKKRTNDKTDGLLLMYREDIFNLLEFSKLELYQTGIKLLNRDNVGLVAKFSLKESPATKFVIATTHLLFNPKRSDIRLGQVQLLLAEIERLAFVENTQLGPRYLPIVLSGDFNLMPHSGVYRFITEGSIEFVGKTRQLERCYENEYRCLSNSLIPPNLYITDECQHFNVLSQRLSGKGNGKVMLSNTENQDTKHIDPPSLDLDEECLVDSKTRAYQKVEVIDGHYVTFSSGLLTHPFQLRSVYSHTDKKGRNEASTFQDRWITVDYIFYSSMKLLEQYRLPTADECKEHIPTIPNSAVGSDHFCLGASFLLKKS